MDSFVTDCPQNFVSNINLLTSLLINCHEFSDDCMRIEVN